MAIQFSQRIQSPLRRKSVSSQPGTPENVTHLLVENDDVAERRNRRLSLMIERQISQSPRGSYNPIAHLNAVQLAEHYTNCMKLSTQNKINSKNAFQLQLIDYMALMLKKKEPEMENFQVVSCTLDASAKIYACRVDNVHSDAFRLAAGFSRTEGDKNKEPTEEGRGTTSTQRSKSSKSKRNSMIETNLDKLNLKERELVRKIDPYFRRMATKFDEGECGGCHLLQSLRFLNDSQEYILSSDVCWWREHQSGVHNPMSTVKIPAPNFNAINTAEICPALSAFTFVGWKPELDHGDTLMDQSENLEASLTLGRDAEHAFDIDATPEEVPMEEDIEAGEAHDTTDDLESVEKLGFTNRGKKSSWEYVSLRKSLSLEPQEYSYFKKASQVGWSGPTHWKVKPILRKSNARKTSLGKKAMGRPSLEYEDLNQDDDFRIPNKGLCLKNSTLESWSDSGTTLPHDLNIYPSTLLRLFLKPKMGLMTKSTSIIMVDGLQPFNFDNTHDQEDYCPNLTMDGDTSEESLELNDLSMCCLPDINKLNTANSGYELVPAPNVVPKFNISYVKQPKRINMKRLQEVIYKIITIEENTQKAVEEQPWEPEALRGPSTLSAVYKKIPGLLSPKEVNNLSIQIVFVALLHVTNTRNLCLNACNDLADVRISKEINEG